MGMFDDLIPGNEAQSNQTSRVSFDDLIPKQSDEPILTERDEPSFLDNAINAGKGLLPAGLRAAVDVAQFANNDTEKFKGVQREAADGLLLGFGDEVEGFAESLVTDKEYIQARDMIREKKKKFQKENPKTAIAANIGGGLLTGGTGLAKGVGLAAANNIGAKAAVAASTGAIIGGVSGAGKSEAGLTGDGVDLSGLAKDSAVGAGVGALAGGLIGTAGAAVSQRIANSAKKDKFISNLIETKPDSRVVAAMIKGGGKFGEKEKLVSEASRQGLDDSVIAMIVGSSKTDRTLMTKMVGSMIRSKRDAKFALRNRPSDIVGKSTADRYKHVLSVNRKAGEQIGEIAKKEFNGLQAGQDRVIGSFKQQLDDLGVDVGGKKLNFKDSDFDSFGASKTLINRVFQKADKVTDAKGAHELKQFIDRFISYGKSNFKSADKEALDLVQSFRKNIDDTLDGFSPSYDAANKTYGSTIRALSGIDDLVGKSSTSASGNFDKTLGTLSRRISSNSMSGGRVDDAILNLSRVADDSGGKFKDDFDSLVVFANELERRFGSSARTSLQGQGENVASQIVEKGLTRAAIDKTGKVIGGIRGVDDKSALISLRRLLVSK